MKIIRTLRLPGILVIVGLAALILGALRPAFAGPGEEESYKEAVAQADGITNSVVDQLWDRTNGYWHDGDYNRVIALCRLCVAADPGFDEAYSAGAWLIWSQGDRDGADRLLKFGVDHSPNKADIAFDFGWHLYNTKRYPEASKYLKLSIDSGNTNRQAYATLAHTYRQMGDYDQSIALWKKIIAKFPNYPAAPLNLKRVEDLKKSGGRPPAKASKPLATPSAPHPAT